MGSQIITKLQLDGEQYLREIRKAQSQAKGFASTTENEMKRAGQSMASLARSVVGAVASFSALKKVIGEGISFNRFMQEQETAFTVMMKSADAAKAKVQELYDFAVRSPLTFKESAGAAKQLMAYGFAANELVGSLETLGTVAKATGHPLSDIAYVYGTLRSQGRAYTRDLMQFGMRGIPIYEELSKVMGVGTEELKKLTEAGKVGFREVEKAFKNMTSEGGRFAGMMDKYMETLSGKLSMLTDVAQQSAGKFTAGITTALTNGIEGIMNALSGSSGTIAEFGTILGGITSALMSIVELAIWLLPLLKAIIATILTAKFIKFIGSMPKLLVTLGDNALVAALNMQTLSAAMAGSAMKGAFLDAATGVKMLGEALMGLVSNPAVLAIAALATGTALIVNHINKVKADRAEMMESNPIGLMKQDIDKEIKGYLNIGMMMPEYGIKGIQDLAKKYGTSLRDTIDAVKSFGLVTDTTVKALYTTISEAEEAQRLLAMKRGGLPMNQGQKEATYYASVVGRNTTMKDFYNEKTYESMGGFAAESFIKGFADDYAETAKRLGSAITTEDTTAALEKEYDALKEKLLEGADILDYANTIYDDKLRERMERIQTILASLGKGGGGGGGVGGLEERAKEMDIWYAREWEVKAKSEDKLLALQLDFDKAVYETDKKYYVDKTITEEQRQEALLAISKWYSDEGVRIEKERLDKLATIQLEGNEEYFNELRRKMAAGYESGDYGAAIGAQITGATQGTQMGTMLSGGDPMAMIIQAMIDFAMTIENVGKILNFVNTILEAARPILEPFINNILSGLVSYLGEIGETVGLVLAPVLNIIGTMLQIWAGYLKTTVVPVMQIFGKIMAWLNDYVIVPIGNAIIRAINGVIDAINWALGWLGVHVSRLNELMTTQQALEFQANMDRIQDSLTATIAYLEKKLNEMISKQIQSAQDLYEVGAISATQYENMVADINKYRIDRDLELVSIADQQLNSLEAIHERLMELYELQKKIEDGQTVTNMGGAGGSADASMATLADLKKRLEDIRNKRREVMTDPWMWPKNKKDKLNKLAIEEMEIVSQIKALEAMLPPAPLPGTGDVPPTGYAPMAGTTLLPTTRASTGDGVYVTVNVNGSVTAENDLAKTIAESIYLQRRRGLLTV